MPRAQQLLFIVAVVLATAAAVGAPNVISTDDGFTAVLDSKGGIEVRHRTGATMYRVASSFSEPGPVFHRLGRLSGAQQQGWTALGPTSAPEGGGGGSGSSEPSGGSSARPAEPFAAFNGAFIPERPDDVNEGMREGIKAGDTPLCLELLASKADPNYRDRQGNTPLHMSCLFNRTEVAKALLLAGSDLTLKNGAGELPERMASVSLKMKFNAFKATGKV